MLPTRGLHQEENQGSLAARKRSFIIFIMKIPSLSVPLCIALAFTALCVGVAFSDDAPVKPVSPMDTLVDTLARPLQNHVAAALNAGEMSQLPPASDPAVKKALDEHLRKIVLKKGDSHFTQEATGGRRPIEIKGFELKGPTAGLVSEADRLNGIEQSVFFSANGTAFREYDARSGWEKWKPGKPGLFVGFKLQLENGAWQVTSSPLTYFRIDHKNTATR